MREWRARLTAAAALTLGTAGEAAAGSPEADRQLQAGFWVCCCGLPTVFGLLMVMIAVIAVRDVREKNRRP